MSIKRENLNRPFLPQILNFNLRGDFMWTFPDCRSAHILAPIVQFLEGHINQERFHSSVRKLSKTLKWNEKAEQAFLVAKKAMAESTLLKHPISEAELSLWADASDIANGETLL
ncbi:transposon Tf2-9 polyprotein [Trichonephila clavipes]|nr:transposon Tf2-9 polyprotein [Trichonephila clavipes]